MFRFESRGGLKLDTILMSYIALLMIKTISKMANSRGLIFDSALL